MLPGTEKPHKAGSASPSPPILDRQTLSHTGSRGEDDPFGAAPFMDQGSIADIPDDAMGVGTLSPASAHVVAGQRSGDPKPPRDAMGTRGGVSQVPVMVEKAGAGQAQLQHQGSLPPGAFPHVAIPPGAFPFGSFQQGAFPPWPPHHAPPLQPPSYFLQQPGLFPPGLFPFGPLPPGAFPPLQAHHAPPLSQQPYCPQQRSGQAQGVAGGNSYAPQMAQTGQTPFQAHTGALTFMFSQM